MVWLKLFCYLNMDAKCSDFFLYADSVVSDNLPNTDFSSYVVYPAHTLSFFVFPFKILPLAW